MSKLIYAKSQASFETAYSAAARASTGAIYRSIAFLEDGYLWTHGQYFKFFDSANPFTVTYAEGADVNAGNIVSLKDKSGAVLTTFDVGVTSVTGDGVVLAATSTGGKVALSHELRAAGATVDLTNTVGTNQSAINIPSLVVNKYGHVTSMSTQVVAVDQVKATVAANTYYLLGHTSSAAGTAEAVKLSTVNVDSSGNLSASKFIGNLNNSLTITLNGGTSTVFNNSSSQTISFYAPTTAGTAGELLVSTGGVPTWLAAVTSIGAGSTNGQIPTAAAVWSAIGAGIASNDAMIFKGTIGVGGTLTSAQFTALATYQTGWTYRILDAGTYTTKFGNTLVAEVGDILIATADRANASWAATDWTVVQTNLDGAVTSTEAAWTNDNLILAAGNRSVKQSAMGSLTIQANGTTLKTYTPISAQTVNIKPGTNVTVTGSGNDITISSTTFVSSVGLTLPTNEFTTTAAITTSGNLSATWKSQAANTFFAAPNGSAGTPAFRSIVASDIPTLNQNTTGQAGSVAQSFILKFNTGTTANTDLYSFNGSTARTIDIKNGTGITLTAAANVITISHNAFTYNTPIADNLTTLASIPLLSTLTVSNGHVTGGTMRKLVAGTNVTINPTSDGNITINSSYVNTWRNVYAYTLAAATTLSEVLNSTIGGLDLQFGGEFLWDSTANELKLGWAEVDTVGAITYAL